jgi:hypothetical protein
MSAAASISVSEIKPCLATVVTAAPILTQTVRSFPSVALCLVNEKANVIQMGDLFFNGGS